MQLQLHTVDTTPEGVQHGGLKSYKLTAEARSLVCPRSSSSGIPESYKITRRKNNVRNHQNRIILAIYSPLNDGRGVALSSQSGFSSSVTQVLTVTSDPRRRNPSIWDSGYKSVFDERARMKTSRHLSAVVQKPTSIGGFHR